MSVISANTIGRIIGDKRLFSELTFGIEDGDRVAVVGANGTGKSSLLRVLAGLDDPDEGALSRRRDLRMEYLSQNPPFNDADTPLNFIFSSAGKDAALVRDYESACHALESAPADGALLRRFEELSRMMDAADAWAFETRARDILSRLNVQDLDAPLGTLSGGYRKRVALARALVAAPDVLFLDEPTNQLDADTIAWLEEYLRAFPGIVVLVTHDRYFLDRVARRIIEMDRGQVRLFEGNFTLYLERKAQLEAEAVRHEERRQEILKKEIAWLKQGCKARTTKQQARIDRVHDMMDDNPLPRPRSLAFQIVPRRLGKKVVELDGITHSADGRTLIHDLTLPFGREDRIGVIGPNGCGKSTLANIITGRVTPDRGSVSVGETVFFGYYDQEAHEMDGRLKAVEYVKEEGAAQLRTPDGGFLTAELVMEQFLFTGQMQHTLIEKLSGGERRRLYLIRTLMQNPNFLILDEPTNDLDIMTLEALEDFLDGFGGCLLIISHDRYFLDRTVDYVLAFEEGGILRKYPGGYEIYSRLRAEYRARIRSSAAPDRATTPAVPAKAAPAAPRLSWKEKKELEFLETEILRLEARLQDIIGEMAACAAEYEKLLPLTEEEKAIRKNLEDAMNRWEELARLAEQSG